MIRRPFFFAVIGMVTAILLYSCFGSISYLILALAGVMLCFTKGEKGIAVIVCFYIIGLLCTSLYCNSYDENALLLNNDVDCNALIIQKKEKKTSKGEAYYEYICHASQRSSINNKEKLKILVRNYNEEETDIIPGDIVNIKGSTIMTSGARNPKCFNYKLYLETRGIHGIVEAEKMYKLGTKHGFMGLIYCKKESYLQTIKATLGDETQALVRGILFGEKDDIDEESLEKFQINGTAHILAVSGLHIGIIYGFISLLWLWKKKWIFLLFVAVFMGVYVFLAGFALSVIRAAMMVMLHTVSRVMNKRYDLINSAAIVATVMLIFNPMQLFNMGFQMSFLAISTIALFIPVIKTVYKGIFLSGAAIQIGLLPYTMYNFNYLSLFSFLINLPVIFITGIIVPLGIMSFIFQDVTILFTMFGKIVFGLCKLIVWINEVSLYEGITSFQVISPGLSVLLSYYFFLFFFVSEEGRILFLKRKRKRLLCVSVLLIITAFAVGNSGGSGFSKDNLVFIDVGQGDCIHIKAENGRSYLIDGGGKTDYNIGKKTLRPYFLKNGVKCIDGAFITHMHDDHYKGVAELCREGMINRLYIYEGYREREKEILEQTGMKAGSITYIAKGDVIELGERERVEILWPERPRASKQKNMEEDENENSLIMKVKIYDRSALVTADVDEECLRKLASDGHADIRADIIKIPHHGSKYSYSEEFAEKTNGRYAVIQVGKNSFGHPNEEVIQNYEKMNMNVLRNDQQGAIGFCITEGGNIKVHTMTDKADNTFYDIEKKH